jgi:hypothetical protein
MGNSTFDLWLIGAHIAKFWWALDEPTRSPCALIAVDALITEVFDSDTCHFGGLAPASCWGRLGAAGKTASFREPTNGDRARRTIALLAAPIIYALQKWRAERNRYSLFFHAETIGARGLTSNALFARKRLTSFASGHGFAAFRVGRMFIILETEQYDHVRPWKVPTVRTRALE